jgi:hypothetical protein
MASKARNQWMGLMHVYVKSGSRLVLAPIGLKWVASFLPMELKLNLHSLFRSMQVKKSRSTSRFKFLIFGLFRLHLPFTYERCYACGQR